MLTKVRGGWSMLSLSFISSLSLISTNYDTINYSYFLFIRELTWSDSFLGVCQEKKNIWKEKNDMRRIWWESSPSFDLFFNCQVNWPEWDWLGSSYCLMFSFIIIQHKSSIQQQKNKKKKTTGKKKKKGQWTSSII